MICLYPKLLVPLYEKRFKRTISDNSESTLRVVCLSGIILGLSFQPLLSGRQLRSKFKTTPRKIIKCSQVCIVCCLIEYTHGRKLNILGIRGYCKNFEQLLVGFSKLGSHWIYFLINFGSLVSIPISYYFAKVILDKYPI